MKKLLTVLFSVAALNFSHAGFEMVQQIEQNGAQGAVNMETTTRAQGDMMRVDVGSEMSTLINTKSKEIVTLIHKQKAFMKVPTEIVAKAEKMAAEQEATQKDQAGAKATGKTEEINGYKCAEYTQEVSGNKMTYWLTTELKGADMVLSQAKTMGTFDPFRGSMKGFAGSEGFPIRIEIESPQMGKMKITTVSIKDATFPASDFAAPADYKAFQMPAGAAPSQP